MTSGKNMTSPRRIVLNIVSSYGRSLVSFVLTLFTARWILQALGEVDFGLFGVIGSIVFFVSLINSTQSATVSRFYAYEIGRGGWQSNQMLTAWFNAALIIHLLMPLLLILVGYPIGIYAINNLLNIPHNRLIACIMIFRISLISFFISVIVVPYMAMFVAMQWIFIMVGFSFVQVVGNVVIAYSLLHYDGDRLIAYSMFLLVLNALSYILPIVYAYVKFPSCRIRCDLLGSWSRIGQMLGFTGWKGLGDAAWGVKSYGSSFLINVNFGPAANAAMSVANQVAAQAESLCRTLANAFSPAITTEEGAGNRKNMVELSLKTCKFGSVLLLLLAIPFLVEMDYWLDIWLRTPPADSAFLCSCFLVSNAITYLTKGHQIAIQANGKIARWQVFDAISYVIALPIACILIWSGAGVRSLGFAFIASMCLTSANRIVFAKKLLSIPVNKWVREVLIPVVVTAGVSASIAKCAACYIPQGIWQLVVVAALADLSICLFAWVVVFNSAERAYVVARIRRVCG